MRQFASKDGLKSRGSAFASRTASAVQKRVVIAGNIRLSGFSRSPTNQSTPGPFCGDLDKANGCSPRRTRCSTMLPPTSPVPPITRLFACSSLVFESTWPTDPRANLESLCRSRQFGNYIGAKPAGVSNLRRAALVIVARYWLALNDRQTMAPAVQPITCCNCNVRFEPTRNDVRSQTSITAGP